ncbi:Copper amine oxidase N-terminal domain-containing protein [Desulfotomaculum arcticum]|uniref:Copper amine oxidase N-terminal domain-containing protein n=1 Tax=Desulfotruncus arcticus DSM 17038 TaxID=1121424 RepID=A0A1I2X0J1_9FIRM|nr:copper amine oxidase N-terminal domain-containing protein [Desulfotruncus arcticus]SFH07035.1 Copper amine oxidase N-terminal domain-containing protein [Desulfotomaculum arcticum] [Desulfotruncus arcticus DSM 17038]
MRLKLTAGLFVSVALIFALTVGAYGEQSSVTDSTYGQDGQPSVIDQVYNGSVIDSTYGQNDQPSVIDQVYNGDSDSAGTVAPQPTPPIGSGITVYVNYEPLTFDVSPVIIDGCTMVPLQAIIEALDAEVQWDNSTKTITATRTDTNFKRNIDQTKDTLDISNQGHCKTVKLTVDQTKAYTNNKEVTLGVPAQLINGRTMVPLRFVSESLGAEINVDKTTKVITINQLTY